MPDKRDSVDQRIGGPGSPGPQGPRRRRDRMGLRPLSAHWESDAYDAVVIENCIREGCVAAERREPFYAAFCQQQGHESEIVRYAR